MNPPLRFSSLLSFVTGVFPPPFTCTFRENTWSLFLFCSRSRYVSGISLVLVCFEYRRLFEKASASNLSGSSRRWVCTLGLSCRLPSQVCSRCAASLDPLAGHKVQLHHQCQFWGGRFHRPFPFCVPSLNYFEFGNPSRSCHRFGDASPSFLCFVWSPRR